MVDPSLPRTPRFVAGALETRAIPSDLDVIPDHPHGRDALNAGGALGMGAPLLHGASRVGGVPGPQSGVDDVSRGRRRRTGASHALVLLRLDQRLLELVPYLCFLGELPAKGLPTVVEIPPNFYVAGRSVCSVPRVYHITHLGGISLLDWQTKPCERAAKVAGKDHINLACRWLTLFPSD